VKDRRHDGPWMTAMMTSIIAQLWQRDRATHDAILKGWITLRLNYRLKRYVTCQHLWNVR